MSLFGSAVQCTGRVGRLLLALLALGLGWYADVARAVQADPEGREAVQPDGTKFTLHLRGDEFFSWHETEAGHAVVKDATDGFWKYAKPAADKAEFQALKDARVGSVDPARHGLKKHAMPDVTVLRKYVQERRRAILGQSVAQETNSSAAVVNQSVEPPPETPPEEPPQPVPVQGRKTVKNIVILACFSNHWDDVNNTVLPAYGRVDTNEYYNLFNQIGHTNDGAVGSVKDYYREISYGKLTIDSIIVKWVKLPREGAYYSNNRGGLAADAVAAAATAGFDFSLGDSNSDGWVDVLDVLHSGYGQESTSDTNDVWSCRGGMSSVVTNSGVKMYNYHTEPALRSSSGTGIERIGTICHETGHFFGLPDLYDYSPLTDGLGKWCLMSGASWNGSSGTSPGHPSAWAKVFLGFAKTVPVHSKTGLSLPRVEDNAVVGMLRDGTTNQEYFLIENRAKVGFDNSAQIYPGVLIYHVDQKNANNDLSTWPHPAVKIEEADGDNSLGSNTTDSEPGDAWTSTSGLSGGFRDQTGNTNTTAMLYQTGSLYSRANDAAFFTYNRLNNFSTAGSNMTLNIQSLKTDAPTQGALPATFNIVWAPSAQATKYEIQEGSQVTLTSFSDGAESEDALYENWYVAGKAQCLVTNASHGGAACYALLSANYGNIESLILRKPFKVTASTVISFYLLSHISVGNGYLKCELSNDNGDTWKTLGTYNGYINSWSLRSYGYTAINAAGISSGDVCLLRFLVDIEYGSGWSSFPRFGFALDDISITGTEIAGHGNWTTLDNNVTGTSYSVADKTAGVYAYRIQPYANGAWHGYGAEGEITVHANQAPTFLNSLITGPDANVAIPFAYDIGNQVTDEINDTVTFSKVSGPTWLSVSTDGTMSGTPPPGSAGTNTFTVRATDLAGAYFEVTLNILVKTPPLANWRLNEAAGPTLFDSVSNFHGTAVGSLVYTQTAAIASAGNFAVKFNGADTAVAIPALNLNTNTVTMTALIKRKGGQATSAGIYFWRDTAAFGLRFGDATTSSNQLVCNWNTSYWTTSLIVPDDQWTFVALAIAPAGGTMYMATNSTVFSANLSGSFTNAAFNSTSYIGYDSGGATRRFNGMMDDVAVYGRTLSSSEITDLAAAAFAQAAPIVTLTSPADGATLTNGTITVSASVVSNDHSIAAVRFYAGLTLLGVDTTEPYTFDWTGMTNGTYALTAKAVYDGVNLVSSLASTVTVTHVSPVIALSSPTNGTIFAAPASINLAAAVTANGNPISKVQFIAGGSTVLAEVLASPYTAAWSSVGVGDYSLKARLFYDSGSTTDSVTLNVTVVTPFQFWQIQYFGSTNNPAAAPDVDNFGNGQNNQFKYVTGLDPTNAAARFVFRIESVDGQPSQKRLVFGPRWNDRIYTPVWITNLLDNASWTALTNSSTNDNGTERTIIDLNATEAQKFYRIRITLP